MDVWPVGLSTGCFYQQSVLTFLETIKAGGFNLIEICSAPSHLPPGEGSIDWMRLASGINAAHFHGLVVLEMAAFGKTREITEHARRSKNFLGAVFREACLSYRTDL